MRVVRAARLHLRDATSDKVYDVDLIENEALGTPERYFVNTRYGRRGATLREGSKTPQPLTAEAAARVFDSVIVAKINGGYRRIDGPEPSAASEPSADGRAAVLRARLSACLHQRWPERERDRLLWRIGELRLAAAAPDLIALARALGPAQASYALVWALARAAGAEAGPILDAIAADAPGSVVRDLARFALAAPLTGAYRPPEAEPDLPGMVARPAEAGDVDGLCGALDGLARHDPGRVGPALVALGRLAQGRPALHATLCAALLRLPARPPYLIGLRRLFKHAEMADDAALFGAAAQRFETAQAMYQAGRSHAYVPDLRRYVAVDAARHGPEARLGLSTATRAYMKRRIWRALRKRGAVGDPAFTALATGFLLALGPEDLDPPTRWTAWGRKPDGTWGRQARARGPLGRNWTASQLLYRHAPEARPRTGSLTFLETGAVDPDRRDEAFPDLWSARPDLALRLAAEGRIEPVARLGLRVLRADPGACAALDAAAIGRLLAAPHDAVRTFAFQIAQARLAAGIADSADLAALVAALLAAALPEARALALRRLEAGAPVVWSDPDLAAALLTSPEPDVQAAVPGLARALPPGLAAPLVARLVAWLRAMPPEPDAAATAAIRGLRAALPLLWPDHDLPVQPETAAALIAHPAAAIRSAGLALLAQSPAGADGLPPESWDALIGTGSEDIRIAALVLLARLDDARLGPYAERIVAFASGPGSAVRQAARPLVARLAAADPGLAPRLARELIGSLFRAAPDDAYAADVVALLREALPGECAALDDGTLWRLLQARADGARRLGAALLPDRRPAAFSVRQIARLGGHPYRAVRDWAMAAFAADPARFQAAAAEAVLLVESDWPDTLAFARSFFETWPEAAWTPGALAVVTDSVKPEVLAFARHLLRSRLRPEDAEGQVLRLLEHPAPSMHLLLTELLTEQAVASEAAFVRLIPLARIVMLQVLRGRVAKDRMAAFLRAEALRSRARAEALLPLFADLTLSGTARDRSAAILALRDIAEAHPGLAVPLVRRPPEVRGPISPSAPVSEGAR